MSRQTARWRTDSLSQQAQECVSSERGRTSHATYQTRQALWTGNLHRLDSDPRRHRVPRRVLDPALTHHASQALPPPDKPGRPAQEGRFPPGAPFCFPPTRKRRLESPTHNLSSRPQRSGEPGPIARPRAERALFAGSCHSRRKQIGPGTVLSGQSQNRLCDEDSLPHTPEKRRLFELAIRCCFQTPEGGLRI